MFLICCLFFFFKQKTAYEMRISDWSSDVCSSDLGPSGGQPQLCSLVAAVVDEVNIFTVGHESRCKLKWFEKHSVFRHLVVERERSVLFRVQIGRASCRERVCQYV